MNPNADGYTLGLFSSLFDDFVPAEKAIPLGTCKSCKRGTTSNLALLYSLLYLFDLDLTEPFDFEESLARSSMNRLALPNYQLHFFRLAPARNEQEQYSDSKVAIRFKLGYVCGSNAYDLSTVRLPRTED